MNRFTKISIFLLRVSLGWMFLYAGVSKIIAPNGWSAAGYLTHASTFSGFYSWLANSNMLGLVNSINEWGLTLLGIALILGIGVRIASILGAVVMLLYYFPILNFPIAGEHSYIVDEHIIYLFTLLALAALRAGRVWGLESWCADLPICSRYPKLRSLIG